MTLIRWGIALTVWAGALLGALQLHTLDLGHSICGQWGCGPPTSALMAMHSFWLLILLPVGLICMNVKPSLDWRNIGKGILVAASIAVVGIGIQDYFSWQPDPLRPIYVVQRFLFRLATLPDWPVLQIGIVGMMMIVLNRSDHRQDSDASQLKRSPTGLERRLSSDQASTVDP